VRRSLAALLLFGTCTAWGADGLDPQQEARYRVLVQELRCLVCQNQSIADSNAPLAEDLREQVRAQLIAGKSDSEITGYLTARYGDFVLYRPPFKRSTALLWLAPALLVLLGVAMALRTALRRRAPVAAPIDQAKLKRLLEDAGKGAP
jgi:cytochrome c-type biogenesis protein CcmH